MKRHYVGFAAIKQSTNEIVRTPCHHDRDDDTSILVRRINADRIDVSYFMNESDVSILARYASVEV
jgi:hypothetical protein